MKKSILILLISINLPGFGQTVRLIEGSLKGLRGEKVIKTEFTYEGMSVGKNDLSEADYIKRKKGEYNGKEPGSGDRWEKAWVSDRKERFEPRFNELFGKYAEVATSGDSKYTLIFSTTRTEPGYNVGPFIGGHASARIDATVTILETANPSNIIAKLEIVNAAGRDAMGYDYDTGLRIQEAYAKSGKELGKFFASHEK